MVCSAFRGARGQATHRWCSILAGVYASLDEWIAHEATSTSPDTSAEFDASVVATAPQEQAEHFGIQLRRHGLRVTVESDS